MPNISQEEKANFLQSRLKTVVDELLERKTVEIFGKSKVDVTDMGALALLRGDRICVSIDAVKYPKYILKYIVAHELAHLVVRGHGTKFWQVLRDIYPEYERGKEELLNRVDGASEIVPGV